LQHTSETPETYVFNMRFRRNISLLHGNGGSSTCEVHLCTTRRSGGEGRDSPVEKAATDLARACHCSGEEGRPRVGEGRGR
jgi:hypothetical protein